MRTRSLSLLLLVLVLPAAPAAAQPACPDSTHLARAEAAAGAHRYAEAVAAPDGQARYEVEAALVPVDERSALARLRDRVRGSGAGRRVAARAQGSGVGREQGQYLLLDVSAQEAGAYDVVLRVRQGRREVEAGRRLVLE